MGVGGEMEKGAGIHGKTLTRTEAMAMQGSLISNSRAVSGSLVSPIHRIVESDIFDRSVLVHRGRNRDHLGRRTHIEAVGTRLYFREM